MTEPNLDKILQKLCDYVYNAGASAKHNGIFVGGKPKKEASQAIKTLISDQVAKAIEQTFIPLSQLYDQYSDECFRLGINDSPQAFFRSEKVKEYLSATLNGVKK